MNKKKEDRNRATPLPSLGHLTWKEEMDRRFGKK
jgi:hypothetical protein